MILESVLRTVLNELRPTRLDDRLSEVAVQNDIERSLTFRREYYKYALGIATALFAFSISFQPTLSRPPVHLWFLLPGWGGLGLAIVFGLRVHLLWAKFLITKRDFDRRGNVAAGDRARDRISASRRVHDVALIVSLSLGVVFITLFAVFNLPYVAPRSAEPSPAALVAAPAATAPIATPALQPQGSPVPVSPTAPRDATENDPAPDTGEAAR